MSILIKGMEMPKNGCKDCIFVNRKWHVGICPILKREVSGNVERGGFQSDCPLIPVPPHGRLIDADALISKIQYTDNFYETPFVDWDDILEVPTVIPADREEEQI